ncbi:MAG: ferritin-like domain-containing protein [Thermoproteota archaeon]
MIGEIMAKSPLDLLNMAIERELDASIRYMWQYLTVRGSDIKDDFKKNALRKFKQAMTIGEHIVNLEDFPANTPENIGWSLRDMIVRDIRAENEGIKLYQKIMETASKEGDESTRKLCEKIIKKEKEQKRVLMCAQARATKKLI